MILDTYSLEFPAPNTADPETGLLAIGGDLSIERLLFAYQNGIFPWYEEGQPYMWFAPAWRMVLFFENLKIHKSTKQLLKKGIFKCTINTCFERVIRCCATQKRKDQKGTWITSEMISAYIELHKLGKATSIEVWKDQELVGGLYGIDLKEQRVFCGESMFSKVSNASKIGFIFLSEQLQSKNYKLLDCQMHTSHLESLGAIEIHRSIFMDLLLKE